MVLTPLESSLSQSSSLMLSPGVAAGSDRAQPRSVTPQGEAGGQAGASEASAALSALPVAPQDEDEPMPDADADQPVKAEPGRQRQGPLHGSSAAPGSSSVADSGVNAAAPLHSPGASAEPDQEAAATAAPAQEGPDGAAAPAELTPVVQPGFQVEVEEPLGWVPPTCAAVSLRLFALDAALVYQPGQPPARERHQVGSVHSMATGCSAACLQQCALLPAHCPAQGCLSRARQECCLHPQAAQVARAGPAPLQDLLVVTAGLTSWLAALSN